MEVIRVNYKDGNIREFNDISGQIISGNSLIITTKKSLSSDDSDDAHVITTSDVIDLATVINFVKITQTRKVNIEYSVSDK